MNPLSKNIMVACQAAVRKHAKGSDTTDAEIYVGIETGIASTITATCEACASGSWGGVIIKSRAAKIEAIRAARKAGKPDGSPVGELVTMADVEAMGDEAYNAGVEAGRVAAAKDADEKAAADKKKKK